MEALYCEMDNALNQIAEEHRHLPSFQYFVEITRAWHERLCENQEKPAVIAAGTGIPDELLRAAGADPIYILGGCREACMLSDDMVPRDADPVSRSILGDLYRRGGTDPGKDLILIPLYSDSMRKIASQLTLAGRKVVTVDMPPIQKSLPAFKKYKDQLILMAEAVCEHLRSHITAASLKKAVKAAVGARSGMQLFLGNGIYEGNAFSSLAGILVQNSYYYAEDLTKWQEMLSRLQKEIWQAQFLKRTGHQNPPEILLLGSPVFFPNGKLPSLFAESNLRMIRNIDPSTEVFEVIPHIAKAGNHADRIFESIAYEWFRRDTSSAYIKNENLRQKIRELLAAQEVEGVVCHILKGQIEPDFELSWFEELFEQADIPVFRLETDYQYQDVEQLRIRMEAFSEMLQQRRYSRRKAV